MGVDGMMLWDIVDVKDSGFFVCEWSNGGL